MVQVRFKILAFSSVAAIALNGCSDATVLAPTGSAVAPAPVFDLVMPTPAQVVVPVGDPGAFQNFIAPNNSLRVATEFWDNPSADNNASTKNCNVGFFATATMPANTCLNETPGSSANRGGYNRYWGDGADKRDAAGFMFSGKYRYRVTLRGSFAGGNSVVGWFTKIGGTYQFHAVPQWGIKTINHAEVIETYGTDWGFFIKNDFNPAGGGCSGNDTDCSDATGGFTTIPFQQFALMVNDTDDGYLIGVEDNKLELSPANGDSDYNDYIFSLRPDPIPCDFITFGRLVTTVGDDKVVISGNAGGNQPGGGILGEFHIDVNGVDNHVANVDYYNSIVSGPFAALPNSRIVTGIAKNGNTVELRLWDGGEPGKNTDKVYVKINGVAVLGANGQFIDQGNMQYHPNCRGPG